MAWRCCQESFASIRADGVHIADSHTSTATIANPSSLSPPWSMSPRFSARAAAKYDDGRGGALSPERVWSASQGYGDDHSEQKDTTGLLFPLIPLTTVWCTCKLVSPLMPLTCQVIVVSDGSQASQRPHVTGRADTNMWAWCSPSEATAPTDGGRQKAPS
jgi:hypothetical protein